LESPRLTSQNHQRWRRGWRAVPRALRIALISVCSTLLGWIVLINVLLSTGAVERLVSGEHPFATVELKLGRAWMLRPDTIHVRDLALSIDGYAIRLHVELPEGGVRIAFFDLLSRSFHTRSITGRHASVTLQRKMPHDAIDERRIERFPEIAAFDQPPIRAPELPDWPPRHKALTVELEGVDVRIDHVWVDELRLDPAEGHLEGNMRFVVGHALRAWDITLDATDAVVAVADDDPLLDGLDLRVALDIDEYNPNPREEHAAIGELTGELEGRGTVRDLSSIAMYLPPALAKVALGGGEGPLAFDVSLASGVLQPGTLVTYQTDAIRGYVGKLVVGTQLHLALTVEEEQGEIVSRARVDLEGVHGGLAGTKGSRDGVVARKVEAVIAFARDDLASSEWPLADARLSIPRLRIADLGVFAEATDAVESLGGSLDLAWKTTRLEDGRYGHDATVQARKVFVRAPDLLVRASTKVNLGARTTEAWTKTTIGKLSADVDDLAIATKNGKSSGTWLRIGNGKIDIHHESGRIDARLRGRIDDILPLLTHTNERRAFAKVFPDHNLTQPLAFDIGMHSSRKGVTIDVDKLSRPALNIRGKLRKVGEDTRFAFQLLHARIGIHGVGGSKPNVTLAVSDEWLEARSKWVESLGSE
jgi:hypothetical protein